MFQNYSTITEYIVHMILHIIDRKNQSHLTGGSFPLVEYAGEIARVMDAFYGVHPFASDVAASSLALNG